MNLTLTGSLDAYGHLWMAVLRQAIDDATIPAHNKDHMFERRIAREWLKSARGGIGSCQWICDVVGIDVEVLRAEFKRRLKFGPPSRRKRINTAGYLHQ